ncbi:DUF2513 domain-containing protein [Staphylococcus pseudintermedius]|uniref:DUF2513 domain-containing protein n=1 Tax=Staphylococcus pseudintermedius TaxID=283734 RepID=UPI0010C2D520|nr:DUF2513 domain-containing protein [Staphylococcus pseudintermedius]AZB66696.1 hypothetical protein [Staphylococcus phage phiSP119-1]EGQ1664728.1 DUF2513 domain-containing protein [Staphylococcus pseudintermedius]EGQ1685689.1 DUF2513 domain-containing protein [Staphylococcus pseudintermedius]EGQ2875388.1 DUF2513 domain-containing protein [Staphylococcus pseudintermedius]EGQ3200421.1 DUF2513 domain-containing protein [Staphylococcus pseudintermedius]
MELNHDCVRLLLLEIEANKNLGEPLTEYNFKDNIVFSEYGFETVMYTLLKLKEAEFINAQFSWSSGKIIAWIINDITWEGHEFLDNIRDNNTWKEVKRLVSKTSSMSLTLMSKLAVQYLSQKFNLS